MKFFIDTAKVEDIKKAIWYLNKAIELHDREEANEEETENK